MVQANQQEKFTIFGNEYEIAKVHSIPAVPGTKRNPRNSI